MRGARRASGREKELLGEEANEPRQPCGLPLNKANQTLLLVKSFFSATASLLPENSRVSQIPVHAKLLCSTDVRPGPPPVYIIAALAELSSSTAN